MTRRLDSLIVIRRSAVRVAAAELARASATIAQHEALAARIDTAATLLAPGIGSATGGTLSARLELAQRMRSAQAQATVRVAELSRERDAAAIGRHGARRALDLAEDAKRAAIRTVSAKREARAVPVRPAK